MRYLYSVFIFFILILFFACGRAKHDQVEPIPHEYDLTVIADVSISGWKPDITRFIYNKENLKKYAGNLAELYSSYGFKKLIVKQYINSKSKMLKIELFELDKSENAFGLYSFDTIGKKQDIGQGAVYDHGILRFWKDRLFVKIVASEDYKEIEKDIISFAKAIANNINYEGQKPDIIELVPEENLVTDSLCFFHHNICLNNIYYVPETHALNLSDETDAVAVQYKVDGNVYPRLIIVRYPDEISAENAHKNFSKLYFDVNTAIYNDDKINVVRTEEGEYNSISLRRNYIVLVFESRSSNTSRDLAGAALKKIGRKD
ncbi:TPA: hypothetical protein ENS27_04895 [bacterium]|nr:hypothetical protein [bacterium]